MGISFWKGSCPRLRSETWSYDPSLPWLRHALNEVILFHGTAFKTADSIARDGFAFRLSRPGLYGYGASRTTASLLERFGFSPLWDQSTGVVFRNMLQTSLALGLCRARSPIGLSSQTCEPCHRSPKHSACPVREARRA